MSLVRKVLRKPIGPEDSLCRPHGRETLQVQPVWERVHPERESEMSRANPHWRETVPLCSVWEDLHTEGQPQPPFNGSQKSWGHGRKACNYETSEVTAETRQRLMWYTVSSIVNRTDGIVYHFFYSCKGSSVSCLLWLVCGILLLKQFVEWNVLFFCQMFFKQSASSVVVCVVPIKQTLMFTGWWKFYLIEFSFIKY